MFSFSSPFSVSLKRIEECAGKNTVPGFEIPGLSEVSGMLSAPEPDICGIHDKLICGCGSLLNTAGLTLSQGFAVTGFNGQTRLYQDFDARMYFLEEYQTEEKGE